MARRKKRHVYGPPADVDEARAGPPRTAAADGLRPAARGPHPVHGAGHAAVRLRRAEPRRLRRRPARARVLPGGQPHLPTRSSRATSSRRASASARTAPTSSGSTACARWPATTRIVGARAPVWYLPKQGAWKTVDRVAAFRRLPARRVRGRVADRGRGGGQRADRRRQYPFDPPRGRTEGRRRWRRPAMKRSRLRGTIAGVAVALVVTPSAPPARAATAKPPLHGRHWVAITGKPLGGHRGRDDVPEGRQRGRRRLRDARRHLHHVGHARAGAARRRRSSTTRTRRRSSASTRSASRRPARRPSSIKSKGMAYPPEYGPLAAVTPGTPGGLMVMLAEYGKLSLADVLAPAIQMADGYPIEAQLADTHRAPEGAAQAVAVLAGGASCRTWARRARRRSRARSSGSPTSRPRCASWSRRSSRR